MKYFNETTQHILIILAATGYYANMITSEGYQLSISLISLSLLHSPVWILFVEWIRGEIKMSHI